MWTRVPDLPKGSKSLDLVESLHKSIRLPNNAFWTLQSQHNVSSGYRPAKARSTSPRRLIPACESKNTSKNKKECNQFADSRLNSRVGVSQTDERRNCLHRINLSKTQTLTWAAATYLKSLGRGRPPWTRPNGLNDDTWPMGRDMATQHRYRFWTS